MATALINRSITTLRTELEFLKDSGVITQDFFDTVSRSLPQRYTEGSPAVGLSQGGFQGVSSQSTGAFVPPPSGAPGAPPSYSATEEWVEAVYDYPAQQPEDLALRVGDRVRVLDKPNPNWSKGVCNGRTGMFPLNYCKPSFPPEKSKGELSYAPPAVAPPAQYQPLYQSQPSYQQPLYQPPFPPASTGYYEQPQAQAQPQAEAQPQLEGHLKKFGKKFGDAAIFGAGATLGGDLINSIF